MKLWKRNKPCEAHLHDYGTNRSRANESRYSFSNSINDNIRDPVYPPQRRRSHAMIAPSNDASPSNHHRSPKRKGIFRKRIRDNDTTNMETSSIASLASSSTMTSSFSEPSTPTRNNTPTKSSLEDSKSKQQQQTDSPDFIRRDFLYFSSSPQSSTKNTSSDDKDSSLNDLLHPELESMKDYRRHTVFTYGAGGAVIGTMLLPLVGTMVGGYICGYSVNRYLKRRERKAQTRWERDRFLNHAKNSQAAETGIFA